MSISTINDLPLLLTVEHFIKATGISRKLAYEIVKKEALAIRVGEKRLLIPKDRFLNYLNKQDTLFNDAE
jgi:hypothetical protein